LAALRPRLAGFLCVNWGRFTGSRSATGKRFKGARRVAGTEATRKRLSRWDRCGYGWKTIAADEGLSLSSAAWFRSTSGAAAPGAWGLVPIGVIEDAAGLGEAFPRFAMALRTEARRGHDAFGLEPAGPALDLENRHAMQARGEGIVRQKLSLRSEAFHAD